MDKIKKLSVTISYDIHVMDCDAPEGVIRDLRELRREGLDILSINDKDEMFVAVHNGQLTYKLLRLPLIGDFKPGDDVTITIEKD